MERRIMSPHGSKESNDLKETIDLNDITLISSSKNTGIIHNSDTFRSLSARLPKFSRPEPNLTKEFFSSLIRPIPHNEIQLVNFHIYGGPSTGKSTLSRAIGYYLKDFYGEKCQCIECSFLPDAIHHIDPTKQVLVISVDDPMGAAEAGGTQDARRASSSDVDLARSTFNAIRHIYAKRVLLYRAQRQYGNPIPDDIVKDIERYHDNRDKLATIFSKAFVSVSAIIFVMWGPQLPTIDQTFHQNKMWNIYKGFSSMDQKRKHELERHLGIFWTNKLGAKEKAWRRETDKDARSWSVIEDPFTNNKGWLYVTPAEENIFFKVDRGGKGFQQKVRDDTEKMDIWAQLIYETRNSLTPPYDPFGKKEDRTRSISNFITDTLKSNKDPRTFEELAPHIQIFLRSLIKGKMQILDNRIIKSHCLNLDERKHIERLAQELIAIIEGEKITPYFKKARNIIHDIARRKLSIYSQFIDKPGNS